jgi:hypothetical protein
MRIGTAVFAGRPPGLALGVLVECPAVGLPTAAFAELVAEGLLRVAPPEIATIAIAAIVKAPIRPKIWARRRRMARRRASRRARRASASIWT